MKIIKIDMIINGIKVNENNETRWILLNDKNDIDLMLNTLLKTLYIFYNDNNDNLIMNDEIIDENKIFYYDIDNKCLKSKKNIKKNNIIFNEKSILFCNKKEIKEFDIAIKPLVLKTIIKCSNNHMKKNDIEKIYQYFMPSSHLALLSKFSKVSDDVQKEILSLSKPQDIPLILKEALQYFILEVLNDTNLQCMSLKRLYSIDTLVELLLIFSTNVFGINDNGEEFEFVALFKYGCRINHSCCTSNAIWKIGTTNTNSNNNNNNNNIIVTFISTKDINIDDEVTQCYFDRERWFPKHLRTKLLQEARFFNCNCFECKQNIDNKRNFYCNSCSSLSSLIILENNSMKCLSCNFIPHHSEDILKLEKLCEDIVMDLINDVSKAKANIHNIYNKLITIAPLHWTNIEISDFLQSQYTSDIKRIGLIYRRIKSLQYNSKSINTNIELYAIISYIEMIQNILKNDLSLIDIKDFIQKEMDFILKINNIDSIHTSNEFHDNHYIVFLLIVYVSLQSLN